VMMGPCRVVTTLTSRRLAFDVDYFCRCSGSRHPEGVLYCPCALIPQ